MSDCQESLTVKCNIFIDGCCDVLNNYTDNVLPIIKGFIHHHNHEMDKILDGPWWISIFKNGELKYHFMEVDRFLEIWEGLQRYNKPLEKALEEFLLNEH